MEIFHRLKFSNAVSKGHLFPHLVYANQKRHKILSRHCVSIGHTISIWSIFFYSPLPPITNQKFARDNKILSPPCSQFPPWWTRAISLSLSLPFFLFNRQLVNGRGGATHTRDERRIGRSCLKGMEESGRLKKKKKKGGVSMQIRKYILVDRWFVVSVMAGRPVISRGCIRRGIDRPMRHHMPLHNGKQITKLPY